MSTSDVPLVAITGATGYLGGLLSRGYRAAGWRVRALTRSLPREGLNQADEVRQFVLGENPPADALKDVDVLIHCAYDLSLTDPRKIWRVNVDGLRRLLTAADHAKVKRIIAISSMSAYEGTTQVYGRAKLAGEAIASEMGATSVRLGLVYGPGWGGMAGALRRLVSLPVVPLVGARSYQFTVHEDDASNALVALGRAESVPTGVLGLAHPDPVPFRKLLETFAHQAGRNPRFAPFPWQPVYAAMRGAELIRLPMPLRADSLLGLVRPAPEVPRPQVWGDLGVSIRPFSL